MRFRFFLFWCCCFTLLLIGGWLLFCHQVVESRDVQVEEQEFVFPQWPSSAPPVRAVVLADPHLAFWDGGKLDRIVETIQRLQPDVIFLLGDFPYGVLPRFSLKEEVCYEKLAPLAQTAPVFYVIGNHDVSYRRLKSEFRRLGFACCNNSTRRYRFSAGQPLDICGCTWSYGPKLDSYLPRNVTQSDDVPLLVIAHYPESFYRHPLPAADLVLAAHTHGGQICDSTGLPLFPFGSLTREQARGGWHRGAGELPLYITRGIGMSKLPIRLNCPGEITLFTLRGSAE